MHEPTYYILNSVDPDQLASKEASWSGSILLFHLHNESILTMKSHEWNGWKSRRTMYAFFRAWTQSDIRSNLVLPIFGLNISTAIFECYVTGLGVQTGLYPKLGNIFLNPWDRPMLSRSFWTWKAPGRRVILEHPSSASCPWVQIQQTRSKI